MEEAVRRVDSQRNDRKDRRDRVRTSLGSCLDVDPDDAGRVP